MSLRRSKYALLVATLPLLVIGCTRDEPYGPTDPTAPSLYVAPEDDVDEALLQTLDQHGFTGTLSWRVRDMAGGRIHWALIRVGQFLLFDPITSLNGDNTCSGCHGPNNSFSGSQSIAIGIGNNNLVGPDRTGPRNMRRAPTIVNAALLPRLMWNTRFEARSGNPFDNSGGYELLAPENGALDYMPSLLSVLEHLPVVDRGEMAGDFPGTRDEMRAEIARRVDAIPRYRHFLAEAFPDIADGAPVHYDHLAKALAAFSQSLIFLNAPLDLYARGDHAALTDDEKQGALLFFGKAGCVGCHAVDTEFSVGDEMFTDYQNHVIGVPQIVPAETNFVFDGGGREDFGREHVTGDPADRYAFRTSPLRNVALQPTFMHNGAFDSLEDAIRHHLNAYESARNFDPSHLDSDLQELGPIEPVLERLDPRIAEPPALSEEEFTQLLAFVRCGLLDEGARPERLMALVPASVPSGLPLHEFQPRSTAAVAEACSGGS